MAETKAKTKDYADLQVKRDDGQLLIWLPGYEEEAVRMGMSEDTEEEEAIQRGIDILLRNDGIEPNRVVMQKPDAVVIKVPKLEAAGKAKAPGGKAS